MANNDNLMDFGRALPAPFTNSPKKPGASSIYSNGTQGTLCSSVIKAILAMYECMAGVRKGGVGICKNCYVGEYKSSVDEQYHLVVINTNNGSVLSSVYDAARNGAIEQYKCNRTNRDGSAILFALMPEFEKDAEFSNISAKLYMEYQAGFPNMNDCENYMCVLCDNVYRRLKDDSNAAAVKVSIDKSGNITRVNAQAIAQHTYEPQTVLFGSFEIFASIGTEKSTADLPVVKDINHNTFIGKYKLSTNRVLTAKETNLVPHIANHIIITDEAISMCKLACGTTGKACAQRNFLLRGGAGSGKTCTAKQVAAGLGLPLVTLTCHPDMSMDELIGVMLPKTNDDCSGDIKVLSDMGGINSENIAKLLNLPDLDTIEYEPKEAYKMITGVEKEDATQQECMAAYTEAITKKASEIAAYSDSKTGTEYIFVEGVLLRAIKYGWVCELQEPTVIARPGVLAGLNNILEQEGTITLPDGRVIVRHPDAVIIATTNVSYEGCRGLNQSVIDRMNQVYDVETPGLALMISRAMNITGETDEETVRLMAEVVADTEKYCRQNSITNGVTGMRVLIDWITSNQVLQNAYKSALNTVIAKATEDEEERYAIITSCLEPFFSPIN